MKKDYSELVFILDRSGSMANTVNDVIGGFNALIDAQKQVDGTASVTLVQFDDQYEVVYDKQDLKKVPVLTSKTYSARGSTALYDAIGKTVKNVGIRLDLTDEKDRPSQVIVTIFTDGFENASREYTSRMIKDIITEQQSKYNWQFAFIGANQDAVLTASSIGISASNAMTYAANSAGTKAAYESLNSTMTYARASGQAMNFSEKDRATQTEAGA